MKASSYQEFEDAYCEHGSYSRDDLEFCLSATKGSKRLWCGFKILKGPFGVFVERYGQDFPPIHKVSAGHTVIAFMRLSEARKGIQ